MKKYISLLATIMSMCLLCACTKSLSLEFNVETGSRIETTFETDEDYSMKLSSDGGFTIKNGNEVVMVGVWVYRDHHNQLVEQIVSQGVPTAKWKGYECAYFTDTDNNCEAITIGIDPYTGLIVESPALTTEEMLDILECLTIESL